MLPSGVTLSTGMAETAENRARRERMGQIRRAKKITLDRVADALGVSKTYIWKLENGDRTLSDRWVERIAPVLGVSADTILKKSELTNPNGLDAPLIRTQPPVQGKKDLPVLGAAIGGGHTMQFPDNGSVFEYVERPARLIGVPTAFAVYCVGDSMAPRYEPGEILHCHPNRPLSRGDYVVVECTDGTGLIKRYVKGDNQSVTLEQFNPAKVFQVPRERIKSIALIVGTARVD